jgi:prepilin-type N-terminal cleavage/methylation domain-containing protein
MNRQSSGRSGFTLVELLVVIAIMAMLGTWGVLKMQSIFVESKKKTCQQNLSSLHTQLKLYETKYGHLPMVSDRDKTVSEKRYISGSAMLLAVWGDPFVEATPSNGKYWYCPSQTSVNLTEENFEALMTPENIHYAARNQEDAQYRVGQLDVKDSSRKILACDKPNVDGGEPHKGHCLCVVYCDGHTGEIERAEFGGKEAQLEIGANSPVEALKAVVGAPGDQ